ncbi:MAG TPA: PAS domain-containing protein, partial [Gammaproteobacteria bacterium]|nr:PAS domain-containing protein [Gammaproteobacteria bacterium]
MYGTPGHGPCSGTDCSAFFHLYGNRPVADLLVHPGDGSLFWGNPAARQLLDLPAEGQAQPFLADCFPGNHDGAVAGLLEGISAHQTGTVRLTTRTTQGVPEHLELQGSLVELDGSALAHILVREAGSSELQQNKPFPSWEVGYGGLYHHILKHASEGFLVADFQTLEALEVNEAFCRMLGYDREEILGRRVDTWLDAADQLAFQEEVARRREPGSRRYEVRLVAKSGARVPVLANASTCDDEQGAPAYSLGFVTDISRLRESEEHANHLTEILDAFPGVVGMCDGHYNFLYHNRYAKELLDDED